MSILVLLLIICSAVCISSQALLTLCVWGYVHNSYIINPSDCLTGITQHPFPPDVILQVEVYSNHSFLWNKRNQALHGLLIEKQRELDARNRNENDTMEILVNSSRPNFCNYSLMELLRMQPVCEAVVEKIEEGWRDLKDEWLDTGGANNDDDDVIKKTNENIATKDNLENNPEDDILLKNTTATDEEISLKNDENNFTNINTEKTQSTFLRSYTEFLMSIGIDESWIEDTESVGKNELSLESLEQLAALVAENKTLYELFDFYSESFVCPLAFSADDLLPVYLNYIFSACTPFLI